MSFTNFSQIQQSIQSGDVSLSDIVQSYINNIEQKNDEINAVISFDREGALERADEIQQRIEDGSAGKLAGMIIGIKDLICEKDKQVTCASNILSNFESVYDATVIERLRNEDAILLGRLNMDEFAMGSSTENSVYGPTKNPVDTSKVPGGSSGGSAAAVAAEFCTASLGSDTGGSIRQPASYCGVVGLKPTYGRVSRHGLVAFASSFDCIGPLTNSVDDAARILETIAGPDPNDNTSSSRTVPNYTKFTENLDSNIKIGVPEEYFGEGLDEEIHKGIKNKLNELEESGAELVPIHLPHMKYSIATYYILATAEASSNLARYDGIRYGHRADIEDVEKDLKEEKEALEEQIKQAKGDTKQELVDQLNEMDSSLIGLYKKSRTEGFGPEVKRRIMLGTYVLSAGYYDEYYAKAQKVRRLIKQDFTEAFEEVDVIVSPTAPTTAFDLDSNQDNPVQMYLNDIYTTSANLAGICGINVPAGTHSNGLPYGMQLMADAFEEGKLFNAAKLVEQLN
ncbi:Asp-tRNA(Asn)/Glu-tRNA(Gln) amidotransferase GatCAB subunit A [Aliifodinibius salipaludis]|uniref:Glutamyl-tRNA(Gln) amidotransferase subunit A n=1 Tax=Fodinibius salipaludis TaxID=2032627 RepID=A0A2A2GD31_9BACT|nr:amidase family protein [Aliifodinibius salipaludis]PAU95546.1 Asp-tRNA(Asn)/Glu-tRNA(Gln) amidotransferase GatCAB subunit A [Aliifodinibius salipaludis]